MPAKKGPDPKSGRSRSKGAAKKARSKQKVLHGWRGGVKYPDRLFAALAPPAPPSSRLRAAMLSGRGGGSQCPELPCTCEHRTAMSMGEPVCHIPPHTLAGRACLARAGGQCAIHAAATSAKYPKCTQSPGVQLSPARPSIVRPWRFMLSKTHPASTRTL